MNCNCCGIEIVLNSELNHHVIYMDVFNTKKRYYFCNSCYAVIEQLLQPFLEGSLVSSQAGKALGSGPGTEGSNPSSPANNLTTK